MMIINPHLEDQQSMFATCIYLLVETGFLSKSYIFEYVNHNHCIACIAIECMEDVDDHSVQTLGHVAIPFSSFHVLVKLTIFT